VTSPAAHRWMLRGVAALLAVAIGSCVAIGADRPPDPHLLPPSLALSGHSARTSRVAGFGAIAFRVVDARTAGNMAPLRCGLLADTPAARATGMMGRRDLAGYDAMVFRWYADSTESFYNAHVPIPLSVAWFDSAGVFVGEDTLAVCTHPCPTVNPGFPYRYALETPRGGLGHLGVGQGSVLLVGGAC